MCSCHLFLISSASVRAILFLSFIVPIFAWNIPLVSLIFLKRSLFIPILLFPFLCIDHLGRLSHLFLLFFGTLQSDEHIFPFLLCLSLLFSAIYKVSSDNHFAFLHLARKLRQDSTRRGMWDLGLAMTSLARLPYIQWGCGFGIWWVSNLNFLWPYPDCPLQKVESRCGWTFLYMSHLFFLKVILLEWLSSKLV